MTSNPAATVPPRSCEHQLLPHPQTSRASHRKLGAWSLLALLAVLLWDFSGADMAMARLAGDAHGFALRGHGLLSGLAHDGAKRLSWALILALCATVWWPVGPWKDLTTSRRLELAVLPLLAGLFITTLKAFSLTSCPWDLNEFGGVAQYLSHWRLAPDGGSGHCFPGGHAAHGFAMMAGYFVFRDSHRSLARIWLAGSILAGLVLGLVQQWRGAHFMSHTLWTALLCWLSLGAMDAIWRMAERRIQPLGKKAAA